MSFTMFCGGLYRRYFCTRDRMFHLNRMDMKKFLLFATAMIFTVALFAQRNAKVVFVKPDTTADSIAVCIGDSVTMKVTNIDAGSYERLSYWYMSYEKPDIAGGSNMSKWIRIYKRDTVYKALVNKEIWYFAKITDLNFGYYAQPVHITVKGTVPVISFNESDTVFCQGGTVNLSAVPGNLGAGNYQWFKNGAALSDDTTASYTVTDTGSYLVAARDPGSECPNTFVPSKPVHFQYVKPGISGTFKPDLKRVTLSTENIYASYQWFSGSTKSGMNPVSGETANTFDAQVQTTGMYYFVQVTTQGGCTANSDTVLINSNKYSIPKIVPPAKTFACRGETITLKLEHTGFATYQWYKNGKKIYKATKDSLVVNSSYSYGTGGYSVHVTTELDPDNILVSDTVNIEFSQQPRVNILNNATTCPETSITLYTNKGYDTYQWYVNDKSSFSSAVPIDKASDTAIDITVMKTESRYYFVQTTYNGCQDVSYGKRISPYKLNPPTIYTAKYKKEAQICLGDSVQLRGGGYKVTYQWYHNGEKMDSVTEKMPWVKQVGTYQLEVRSTLCPNMDSVMSKNAIPVDYRVKPKIVVTPGDSIYWYKGDPSHYIFCNGDSVTMSVKNAGNYNGFQWIGKVFSIHSPSDQWTDIDGATDSVFGFRNGKNKYLHFEVRADSVMADSNTCSGISDYITIDGWVFSPPIIARHNVNGELCQEGDSVELRLGFPGEWGKFVWFRVTANQEDSTLTIDTLNVDNDTLYAKEPGTYIIGAYPEKCPNHLYTSGSGANISYMPDPMLMENDTVLWAAMPRYKIYKYQWYYSKDNPGQDYMNNMTPLDNDTLKYNWILWFSQMKPGYYAMEVTNPENCIHHSKLYNYQVTGIRDAHYGDVKIFPNPVNNTLNIALSDYNSVLSVKLYSILGQLVSDQTEVGPLTTLSMKALNKGVYVLRVTYRDHYTKSYRIIKK